MGTKTVARRTNRCNTLSFPRGLEEDLRMNRRAEEFGRSDPSWHGPGSYGLRHYLAAGNPKAVPGVRLYG
jgi:hypothetical protein